MRFNTSGPCEPGVDYMLPAVERLPGAHALIDNRQYFVVHAPRQSGKTTALLALADELNAPGDRLALYLDCETTMATEGYEATESRLLETIRTTMLLEDWPEEWLPPDSWPDSPIGRKLQFGLQAWARRCPVPIVLLFDEIDTLAGDSLITVLRQLRAGFPRRHRGMFPASVVLCGMRNIRDYKAASGGNPDNLKSASPFNIAVESLTIANFTRDDIATLYTQHTCTTGQEFTGNAIDLVFGNTAGQPWLVNAIAREITVKMGVRPPDTITVDHVEEATRRLIAARATHLDSLAARLDEPRVQRVIEPLIAGEAITTADATVYDDDLTYAADLGIVNPGPPVVIANPVYSEVISRLLAQRVINAVRDNPHSFLLPDGRVDLDRVLREFVAFWREQGELMASGEGYNEAGAQLVLLGYLYRIMNGGGIVQSQPGLGRHRVDILIRKNYTDSDGARAVQREALELKVWRDHETDPVDQGLDQLDIYLAKLGLDTGTLVVFDRRSCAAPLVERGTFTHDTTADGRKIQVLRL